MLVAVAREKGVSGYPAMERTAGRRYIDPTPGVWWRLGSKRHRQVRGPHAVEEEGVPTRYCGNDRARAAPRGCFIAPSDVGSHFGWIGTFVGMDLAATSTATQALLRWTLVGLTLSEDFDSGAYSVTSRSPTSVGVR